MSNNPEANKPQKEKKPKKEKQPKAPKASKRTLNFTPVASAMYEIQRREATSNVISGLVLILLGIVAILVSIAKYTSSMKAVVNDDDKYFAYAWIAICVTGVFIIVIGIYEILKSFISMEQTNEWVKNAKSHTSPFQGSRAKRQAAQMNQSQSNEPAPVKGMAEDGSQAKKHFAFLGKKEEPKPDSTAVYNKFNPPEKKLEQPPRAKPMMEQKFDYGLNEEKKQTFADKFLAENKQDPFEQYRKELGIEEEKPKEVEEKPQFIRSAQAEKYDNPAPSSPQQAVGAASSDQNVPPEFGGFSLFEKLAAAQGLDKAQSDDEGFFKGTNFADGARMQQQLDQVQQQLDQVQQVQQQLEQVQQVQQQLDQVQQVQQQLEQVQQVQQQVEQVQQQVEQVQKQVDRFGASAAAAPSSDENAHPAVMGRSAAPTQPSPTVTPPPIPTQSSPTVTPPTIPTQPSVTVKPPTVPTQPSVTVKPPEIPKEATSPTIKPPPIPEKNQNVNIPMHQMANQGMPMPGMYAGAFVQPGPQMGYPPMQPVQNMYQPLPNLPGMMPGQGYQGGYVNSPFGFAGAFVDTNESRYNPAMPPYTVHPFRPSNVAAPQMQQPQEQAYNSAMPPYTVHPFRPSNVAAPQMQQTQPPEQSYNSAMPPYTVHPFRPSNVAAPQMEQPQEQSYNSAMPPYTVHPMRKSLGVEDSSDQSYNSAMPPYTVHPLRKGLGVEESDDQPAAETSYNSSMPPYTVHPFKAKDPSMQPLTPQLYNPVEDQPLNEQINGAKEPVQPAPQPAVPVQPAPQPAAPVQPASQPAAPVQPAPDAKKQKRAPKTLRGLISQHGEDNDTAKKSPITQRLGGYKFSLFEDLGGSVGKGQKTQKGEAKKDTNNETGGKNMAFNLGGGRDPERKKSFSEKFLNKNGKKATQRDKGASSEIVQNGTPAQRKFVDASEYDEWTCPGCGSVNQEYVGVCSCGERKPRSDW